MAFTRRRSEPIFPAVMKNEKGDKPIVRALIPFFSFALYKNKFEGLT